MPDKTKFYIEASRRKKLIKDMSEKYDNILIVRRILTDSVYSELTGIYVPDVADFKGVTRFQNKKNKDIELLQNILEPKVVTQRQEMTLADILRR